MWQTIRRIMIALGLLVMPIATLQASGGVAAGGGVSTPEPGDVFTILAEVRYVSLEGGYYRLVDEAGETYLPTNFKQWPNFQQDALRVSVELRKLKAGYSFQMGGETRVEIVSMVAAPAA